MNRMKRLLALPLAALALLTIAACGDDSDTDAGAAGEGHNSADVTFATDMVPHHAQAVQMAEMALEQASSQQVSDLAEQIKAAQQPEIEQMTAWLEAWGEPTPDTSMSGMDHGDMSMPGMMSSEDMDRMAAAQGAAFDRMWLEGMIQHHEGAITQAETELENGENADAQALADVIIEAQMAEIDIMTGLLDNLDS